MVKKRFDQLPELNAAEQAIVAGADRKVQAYCEGGPKPKHTLIRMNAFTRTEGRVTWANVEAHLQVEGIDAEELATGEFDVKGNLVPGLRFRPMPSSK